MKNLNNHYVLRSMGYNLAIPYPDDDPKKKDPVFKVLDKYVISIAAGILGVHSYPKLKLVPFWEKKIYEIAYMTGYYRNGFRRDDYRRLVKYIKFYLKNGFSPSDVWNLDVSMATQIKPMLKLYRECPGGYPCVMEGISSDKDNKKAQERWDAILGKMIKALDLCINKYDGDVDAWNKNQPEIKEGLTLFAKYFQDLWN